METLKKYLWLFLLIPIGGYLVYVYYRSKKEVNVVFWLMTIEDQQIREKALFNCENEFVETV